MFMGAVSAFMGSLVFGLILPAILGVVLAVLVSGLAILDPLHAADRIEASWRILKEVLIFQGLHMLITAPLAGALIGTLRKHLPTGWIYSVGGVLLMMGLHYAFSLIFILVAFLGSADTFPNSVTAITILLATFISPLIGFIVIFSVRRWTK
jgi:hypothetical protein